MTNVCKNWSSENNLSNPITWDVCLEWAPLQISITWNHDENDFFFVGFVMMVLSRSVMHKGRLRGGTDNKMNNYFFDLSCELVKAWNFR